MSELYQGRFYVHPEDGLIQITGGQKWSNGRLSNHFCWTILQTGKTNYGYAGVWPEYNGGKIQVVKYYEVNGVRYGPEVKSSH